MNAHELMADLPCPLGHEADARLYARLFLRYLADNLYSLQLNSGAGLRDVSDVKQVLDECIAVISPVGPRPPKVAERLPQPRWKSDPVCPDCDHVHEGRNECSKYLGEGKFCQCESKVAA